MLPTARQGCKSLPRSTGPSWCRALPAESSRQALLRATLPARPPQSSCRPPSGAIRRSHGKARYSAAALAIDERISADRTRYEPEWSNPPSRTTQDPSPWPPDIVANSTGLDFPAFESPPSIPPDDDRPILQVLRSLSSTRPLDSLRILAQLNESEIRQLSLEDLDDILEGLWNIFKLSNKPRYLNNSDEYGDGLRILRDTYATYIHHGPGHPPYPGGVFRNKRLSHFLRICLSLDQDRLLRSTFRERLKEQSRIGKKLVDADVLIKDMVIRKDWNKIINLFAPSIYPYELYSPYLLENYLLAHLATTQAYAVPGLFALHQAFGKIPTAGSYAHLTQAYLRLGNLDGARETRRRAELEGKYDPSAQQMALLAAHRALGMDASLEERVLKDLKILGGPMEAGVINALIRIRTSWNDYPSAEKLLRYFNFDWLGSDVIGPEDRVEPNAESRLLAFQVTARRHDVETIRRAWTEIAMNDEVTKLDEYFAILLHTLYRLGQPGLAMEIATAASKNDSVSSWPLPENLKPSSVWLNALLDIMSKTKALGGMEQTARLFNRTKVAFTPTSVKIILQWVKKERALSPVRLALLLQQIRTTNPHIEFTIDHLDIIMSHAIQTAPRDGGRNFSEVASENIDNPSGGILVSHAFQRSLRRILRSLSSQGVQPTSTTLANRLRLDALRRATTSGGIPSAKSVWTAMIFRGYQPTSQHLLALMKGYANARAMTEAESILGLADELNIPITDDMWMTLIVGWGKLKNYPKASMAYSSLCKLPNGKDLRAITSIIQAAYRSGEYSTARRLVHMELGEYTLDKTSGMIAAIALEKDGYHDEALGVVSSIGPGLTTSLRRFVRKMKNDLLKLGGNSQVLVDRCKELLEKDDLVRPVHTRKARPGRTFVKLLRIVKRRSRGGRGGLGSYRRIIAEEKKREEKKRKKAVEDDAERKRKEGDENVEEGQMRSERAMEGDEGKE